MKIELSKTKIKKQQFSHVLKLLGVNFPKTFYELLKCNDGGYPNPDSFIYFDQDFDERIGGCIAAFLPLSENLYGNLLSIHKNPPEFFPNGLIAFAEDGGGNFICFDYREGKDNDNPPIVFWNHAADIGKDVSLIENSFDEFVNSLKSGKEVEDILKNQ